MLSGLDWQPVPAAGKQTFNDSFHQDRYSQLLELSSVLLRINADKHLMEGIGSAFGIFTRLILALCFCLQIYPGELLQKQKAIIIVIMETALWNC
jgi:hypothetical protein